MNVETALVSKIVSTGSIEKTIIRGISAEHFQDEGCKAVYEIMVSHTQKYKIPPSPDVVVSKIKAIEKASGVSLGFAFDYNQDALEYLIEQFVGTIKYRATIDAIRELAKKTNDETSWKDLDLFALEIARDLALVVPSSQTALLSDVKKRIEEYERRKRDGNPWGIKTGITSLDILTMGLQPYELATIAGWMGVGKSTLLQYMLWNAYIDDHTPMMISGEMEATALFRKWDTMATNMSYTALKAMSLGEGDMEQWEKWGEKAEAAKADRDIIVIDDIGRMTVDNVFAEAVRYTPDLVAVDYIGLMEAPANVGTTWEKVTYCTKALKQNARSLHIPHVVVAQTNREDGGSGAELDRLAGSLSIGRDSDLVYGMFQDEQMKEDERMEVKLLKSRDSGQGKALLKWQPSTMEFRELPYADSFK